MYRYDCTPCRSTWQRTTSSTNLSRKTRFRPRVLNVRDSTRLPLRSWVFSVRENQISKGLPPYQNQCFPGAGIIAIRSLRSVVSRSSHRIRWRNFWSRNHSFTHTNAASSSFTVIIMVLWLTIQYQMVSGTARSHTLTPPMIISRSPPDANSFRPVSTLFRICNIFVLLTGTRPELLVECLLAQTFFGRGISDHVTFRRFTKSATR